MTNDARNRTRRVITLLTDFGSSDTYVGVMKGVILGISPDVRLVDLCHHVTPQDTLEAAYLLSCSYSYFPDGTIHVVVVDPGVGGERQILAVRAAGQFFLAPDNGVLSFVFRDDPPDEMVAVTNEQLFRPEVSATFHGRDVFAPVAAHLAQGKRLSDLGQSVGEVKRLALPEPRLSRAGRLVGQVIHVDRFGNLITNITRLDFGRFHEGAAETNSRVTLGHVTIERRVDYYAQGEAGELVTLFGSSGRLEISVVCGHAADETGLRRGVTVELAAETKGDRT